MNFEWTGIVTFDNASCVFLGAAYYDLLPMENLHLATPLTVSQGLLYTGTKSYLDGSERAESAGKKEVTVKLKVVIVEHMMIMIMMNVSGGSLGDLSSRMQ